MRQILAGWAVAAALIYGLGQFSVHNYYRTADALAAWRAEAALYDTTTYADDRIVYKVASVLDTNVVGTDTTIYYAPDLTAAPAGARAEVLWKPNSDSTLLVTGDTFDLAQLDSATATAVASAWGVRDPYTVDLAWHTPPSGGGAPDTVGALIHVNFDVYDSTGDYRNDITNVWTASSNIGMQWLDTVYAPTGLSKSLRLDYTYTDSTDFCHSITIGNGLNLPDYDTGNYREVWFEVAVRMDSASSAGPPAWLNCAAAAGTNNIFAWKTQQIYSDRGTGYGRWQLVAGNSGATTVHGAGWKSDNLYPEYNSPGDQAIASDMMVGWDASGVNPTSSFNDGEWHKLRFHIRMGSDSTVADGTYTLWQDTLQVIPYGDDPDSLHRSPTGVYVKGMDIGRNKDKGGWYTTSSADLPWVEHTWIGYITAWVAPDTPAWYSEVTLPSYLLASVGDTSNALAYWFADNYQNGWEDIDADASAPGISDSAGVDHLYQSTLETDTLSIEIIDSTSYGPLNKAMQFNYIYDDTTCVEDPDDGVKNGCEAITIGAWLQNTKSSGGAVTDSLREFWVEYALRIGVPAMGCSFDSTWAANNLPYTPGVIPSSTGWSNPDPPCAWKVQEWQAHGDYGRILYTYENTGCGGPNCADRLEQGWANPGSENVIKGDLAPHILAFADNSYTFSWRWQTYLGDGEWHRVRYYVAPSSDTLTFDSRLMLWLDDSLWVDNTRDGWTMKTSDNGYFSRMRLGANKDHGGMYEHTEHMFWSHGIVWTDTPSWFPGG